MSNDAKAPAEIELFSVAEGKTVRRPRVERTPEEWRQRLTPAQYKVARDAGTERAFSGIYANTKAEGVYRCVGCSTDLFASGAKFDSGTGWPSFSEPVAKSNVETHTDRGWFMTRVEVRCARCQSHLGHLFDDGPEPTGMRYCINSAALDLHPAGSEGTE